MEEDGTLVGKRISRLVLSHGVAAKLDAAGDAATDGVDGAGVAAVGSRHSALSTRLKPSAKAKHDTDHTDASPTDYTEQAIGVSAKQTPDAVNWPIVKQMRVPKWNRRGRVSTLSNLSS